MPSNTPILGTIISSVLDYDALSTLVEQINSVDPTKSIWIPCDGRSMAGSKLATITKQRVTPDLRGRFLRGLNTIHSPGEPDLDKNTADPEGDNRHPWHFQADTFARHSHEWKSGKGFNAGGGHDPYSRNDAGFNINGPTTEAGSNETRPRNIAVFYYIKIN